ncbi:uncharacterized protein LOC129748193 [Uranotaenia lowii]|uniref:uncharacterized protein LOC129748193 n=1 Tax=Uranotaenia lowii TaxID=190385 RepID=UPI00247A333F|nr:uncharacterized protein LOC129748193 [Uranotaenia lowii]
MKSSLSFLVISISSISLTGAAFLPHLPEWDQVKSRHERPCAKFLGISNSTLDRYSRSEFDTAESEDFYCFYRCVLIVDESYDDKIGLVMYKMMQYFADGTMDLNQFFDHYQGCLMLDQTRDGQWYGKCEKAYRKHSCMTRKHQEMLQLLKDNPQAYDLSASKNE